MSKDLKPFYAILQEVTGLPREKLGDGKSLTMNLGIAGADGWELIDELTKVYKIDWKDFDPDGHFGPEVGFNPFLYAWNLWTGDQQAYEAASRKVTVGHLKAVCLTGRWLDPA